MKKVIFTALILGCSLSAFAENSILDINNPDSAQVIQSIKNQCSKELQSLILASGSNEIEYSLTTGTFPNGAITKNVTATASAGTAVLMELDAPGLSPQLRCALTINGGPSKVN